MTQRVADEVIAGFSRQQHDWMGRVLKGSLDPKKVAQAVQRIINKGRSAEGCSSSSFEFVDIPCELSNVAILTLYLGGMEKINTTSFSYDQVISFTDIKKDGEMKSPLSLVVPNIFFHINEGGGLVVDHIFYDAGWQYMPSSYKDISTWPTGTRIFRNKG